jgi:hypothetical protein
LRNNLPELPIRYARARVATPENSTTHVVKSVRYDVVMTRVVTSVWCYVVTRRAS